MKNLQAKNILKIHFICRVVLISAPTLQTNQDWSVQFDFVVPVMNGYGTYIVQSIVSRYLFQRI